MVLFSFREKYTVVYERKEMLNYEEVYWLII